VPTGDPCGLKRVPKLGEGRYVAVEVSVHDADGELVSSAYSIGSIIDNALRQRRSAPEATRILATLLFTDVVGSTERAERLGDDRWRALLDEHYSAIRTEVVRHNGIEVNTTGDGMLIRFDAPIRAVECARAIVASIQRLGLSIRTGIHTGECDLKGRSLTGMAVHIAARVQAHANPGEILVSNVVKDLALGSGIRFEKRGDFILKGVPGDWRLYAVSQ